MGHQEPLGFEDVRMGASEDLGGRPVELVDGWVGGWKSFVDIRSMSKRERMER